MAESRGHVELRCRACSWREACGREAIGGWLRKARKVRPGREPEEEILRELLRAAAPDYCPRCGGPMELRLSRSGGITRYVLVCAANPPCRL